MTFRVGHGLDVHRFAEGGRLVLCGVVVDETRGVAATSDGDLAAHAVTDALLGAVGLGDIGELAPESDPTSHGADSMAILRRAVDLVTGAGWLIGNVDITVVAQRVRIAPYRAAMRTSLAATLGVADSAVSVKATTTDGLGVLGADEGIAVIATVTVVGGQPE